MTKPKRRPVTPDDLAEALVQPVDVTWKPRPE